MALPAIDQSDAPAGYHYVWTAEADPLQWIVVAPGNERTCRATTGPGRKTCRQPSVAALNRGYQRWPEPNRPSWWHYCGEHLYGRILVDGALYYRRLVHFASEAEA